MWKYPHLPEVVATCFPYSSSHALLEMVVGTRHRLLIDINTPIHKFQSQVSSSQVHSSPTSFPLSSFSCTDESLNRKKTRSINLEGYTTRIDLEVGIESTSSNTDDIEAYKN